jgi:hypothetical protein
MEYLNWYYLLSFTKVTKKSISDSKRKHKKEAALLRQPLLKVS